MSSIRVAVASCVLMLALGAGTWGAVKAFPLYGSVQDQKPPRDPLSPEAHHRVAQEYWEKANKDTSLTPEEKLNTILKGIAADDRALTMNPDYVPALTYKNIFLRMQANLTDDVQERDRLIRQADELRDKAIALGGRVASAGLAANTSAVMSEEYRLHVEQLNPVRIGGNVKMPTKTRDVKPVYPPIAQSARVQGVVIVETLVDSGGKVVDARILRSIPLLDEAALAAVRQWEFAPTVDEGAPRAVLMTVTVNFTLAQ